MTSAQADQKKNDHEFDEEKDDQLNVCSTDELHEPELEEDPWEATNLVSHQTPWNELDRRGKVKRVLWEYICRMLLLIILLYLFICSLDLLSSAFRLLGGRAAGKAFANNEVLQNPIAGLMVGILATVLVQSSSTSTSIIITMVGAELLRPKAAVPIIMGANIGTSVTNTIVSMGHINEKNSFRRAFGGATVHDVFNWLSVLVLLPIEVASGVLYRLSQLSINSMNLATYTEGDQDLLKTITKPLTKLIVSIDTDQITKIAQFGDDSNVTTLIKIWCHTKTVTRAANVTVNDGGPYNTTASGPAQTTQIIITETEYLEKCRFMFSNEAGVWSDVTIGAILLVMAVFILCICLVSIVRLLHALLRGQIAVALKKFVNADCPGYLKFVTGYLAILLGAGFTFLVQSSSIFTSALTPLVGVGVLKIQRMYPLTLGSNIGTTSTGILAALATSGKTLPNALQIAFVHFYFNIIGILIWYPIPWLRKVPIIGAKFLGNTTADYRWFAILYLLVMFFILPAIVFGLSLLGWIVTAVVLLPIVLFLIIVIIVNVIQRKRPSCLPEKLRSWNFLPLFMHSLEPYDRGIQAVLTRMHCCKFCLTVRGSKESHVESGQARNNEAGHGVVNESFVNASEKARLEGHHNIQIQTSI